MKSLQGKNYEALLRKIIKLDTTRPFENELKMMKLNRSRMKRPSYPRIWFEGFRETNKEEKKLIKQQMEE